MMDKLALEMETFEEILERFEVDVKRAKECGDYSQMVRLLHRCTFCILHSGLGAKTCHSVIDQLRHTSKRPSYMCTIGTRSGLTLSCICLLKSGGKYGLREQYPRRDQ